MDHRHLGLLFDLRYAMDEALGKSERVMAAIVALQHAGQGVKIAIHTALEDVGVPTACCPAKEGDSDSTGMLRLSATDMLFLQDLKIGLAER